MKSIIENLSFNVFQFQSLCSEIDYDYYEPASLVADNKQCFEWLMNCYYLFTKHCLDRKTEFAMFCVIVYCLTGIYRLDEITELLDNCKNKIVSIVEKGKI